MQCTLVIPHLLLPGELMTDACRGLALDDLRKILARSNRAISGPAGVEAWLCRAFDVEKQRDWPVAPLTLALDGGIVGADYWLRADPVHLRMRRNRLVLADDVRSDLSRNEADRLVAALNQHFGAEGLQFAAPVSERWYLRLPGRPEITTLPLNEVVGTDVNTCLPTGNDALSWHRKINEIQMLLHEHPVNAERDARGKPAINSVWLWGGGRRPAVPGRPYSAVWSDDPLACALAGAAGLPARSPPPDARRWLQESEASCAYGRQHLLVLGLLADAIHRADMTRWREAIELLNRDWLAPLLPMLRARRVTRVTLVAPAASCNRFDLAPSHLFRFWRANNPLSVYAPTRPGP